MPQDGDTEDDAVEIVGEQSAQDAGMAGQQALSKPSFLLERSACWAVARQRALAEILREGLGTSTTTATQEPKPPLTEETRAAALPLPGCRGRGDRLRHVLRV